MGYTSSTVHGIPVPDSSQANNVPTEMAGIVTVLETGSLVKRLTQTTINALTAGQKPAGLLVYNTTAGVLQVSNGSTFTNVEKSPGWTSYTPTLTASTANPTNWTQVGYYHQVGKLVHCKWLLTAGGSMTQGTGGYRIALPVAANMTLAMPAGETAYALDSSVGSVVHPRVQIDNTNYVTLWYPAATPFGTATQLGAGTPVAWASGDILSGGLIYEAA